MSRKRRERREAALASELLGRLSGCPAAGELGELREDRLPPERAAQLRAHAGGCSACEAALGFLDAAPEQAGEGNASPAEGPILERSERLLAGLQAAGRRRGPRLQLIGLAAAAALALALILVPFLPEPPPAGPPSFRQPEEAGIRPLVPDGGALPRDRFRLRWSAGPPGSRDAITVLTSDLRVLDRARELERPEHRVPAGALAGLPAGAEVLWQVERRLPDGSVSRSVTFVARLE